MRYWLNIFFFIFCDSLISQTDDYLDTLIRNNLKTHSVIFKQPGKYRLQVIYTEITRDKNNKPSFKNFYWHADSTLFFYPASLVKLPVSIIALEKLHELKNYGIDKFTPMLTDSVFFCQKKVYKDITAEERFPSIAHYIKKMFLVSDNYAFARTYEFAGTDFIHQRLEKWGFQNMRIVNRLDGSCPGDTARITPPVYFVSSVTPDTLYKQPLTFATYAKSHPLPKAEAGKAHTTEKGKRIYSPKDFSRHNFMSLANCHEILKRLVFLPYEKSSYDITEDDRKFLLTYLGMYPRESAYPRYEQKEYHDGWKKYLFYGGEIKHISGDSIREFNIVGRAYGFLSDCAYFADEKNGVEFMLSATIYVNEDNIVGNGKYEYEKIALPLFKDLGNLIYKTEQQRKLKYKPDLKEFGFFKN